MSPVTEHIIYSELLWPEVTLFDEFLAYRNERWAEIVRVERCGLVVLFKLRILSYITEQIYVEAPYLSEEALPYAWREHTGQDLPQNTFEARS